MARYVSDQNKLVLLHESGTYATASGGGVWIGQVQDVSIDDSENPIITRYLGDNDRSIAAFDDGPRDLTGTITYNPHDMLLVAHAIGSVYSESGTNSTHTATEINNNVIQSSFTSGGLNAPFSFTLEDSKQAPGTGGNFIRTLNGCCANICTITATQGEKINVDLDFLGKSITFGSGTTTAVTEPSTPSYVWGDASLTVAGSSIETAKEVSFEVNQNLEGPHYVAGEREIAEPIPLNRDYTLSFTADLDQNFSKMFYEELFRGGSEFNAVFDLNHTANAGSQHAVVTMSGCLITSMDTPSAVEGVQETTVEIRPKNVSMIVYDQTPEYNPW